ncbi:MAG: lycopene cyclase domain-containing protein [Candidatus Nanopelagicales bacterium]
MGHLAYLGVLAGCLIGTAWLELALRTRVYRRWLRLFLTVLPVVVIFSAWDLYAIASDHWDFDPNLTTTVFLPGGLPLDEVLFFVVIPICAVLTLEAVRSVTGWELGDEALPAQQNQEVDPPRSES